VVLWNPGPGTLAACKLVVADGKEVEVRRRTEGSIPCLRWKGGEAEKGGVGRIGEVYLVLISALLSVRRKDGGDRSVYWKVLHAIYEATKEVISVA
jgi:hypothetical protein